MASYIRRRKFLATLGGAGVLRARKVLLALQVLPRTRSELYASTARPQRAEGSATSSRYLSSGTAVRAEVL